MAKDRAEHLLLTPHRSSDNVIGRDVVKPKRRIGALLALESFGTGKENPRTVRVRVLRGCDTDGNAPSSFVMNLIIQVENIGRERDIVFKVKIFTHTKTRCQSGASNMMGFSRIFRIRWGNIFWDADAE